jgi:hypothetical protein
MKVVLRIVGVLLMGLWGHPVPKRLRDAGSTIETLKLPLIDLECANAKAVFRWCGSRLPFLLLGANRHAFASVQGSRQ